MSAYVTGALLGPVIVQTVYDELWAVSLMFEVYRLRTLLAHFKLHETP